MENNTIYTWLFIGIGLSIVSKLLLYQDKKKAGNIIVIPAAFCLLTALLFTVTDFARLYGRAPQQALSLLGLAGVVVAIFQIMMIRLSRSSSFRQAGWFIPIIVLGLSAFFWLWQRWV